MEQQQQQQKVHDLRVDVEVLKRDVGTLTNLCEKMDKVIEKLVAHQDVIINQIYTDMDKRRTDTNTDIKELNNRITTVDEKLTKELKSTENKIMDEIKSLRAEIMAHNLKEDSEIEKILRMKWSLIGGMIVLSWVFSHVDLLVKLLGS